MADMESMAAMRFRELATREFELEALV
jgi:hypothetical protein